MVGHCGRWAVSLVVACALLAGCAPAPNPAEFSPAGDRLVFPWGPSGVLYEARSDGAGVDPLPGTEGAVGPRWSPRGDLLAFEQDGELVLYDLVQRQVAQRIAGSMTPVAWAPDGQRLGVFRHTDDQVTASWYQLADRRLVASIPLPVQRISAAQTPRWLESRDGMAFMAANGDAYQVYTVEGGDVYRISSTGDVLGFGLASDGEHLIWARGNPQVEGGLTLWSYDLRLRSVRKLPFQARFASSTERRTRSGPIVTAVQFASGSERLAIVVEKPRQGAEVWTCALDGSQLKLIQRTSVAPSQSKRRDVAYDSLSPVWSPDGKQLAVVMSGVHPSIRIHRTDGTGAVQLPLPPASSPPGG